jgi:hypothetical protein
MTYNSNIRKSFFEKAQVLAASGILLVGTAVLSTEAQAKAAPKAKTTVEKTAEKAIARINAKDCTSEDAYSGEYTFRSELFKGFISSLSGISGAASAPIVDVQKDYLSVIQCKNNQKEKIKKIESVIEKPASNKIKIKKIKKIMKP